MIGDVEVYSGSTKNGYDDFTNVEDTAYNSFIPPTSVTESVDTFTVAK